MTNNLFLMCLKSLFVSFKNNLFTVVFPQTVTMNILGIASYSTSKQQIHWSFEKLLGLVQNNMMRLYGGGYIINSFESSQLPTGIPWVPSSTLKVCASNLPFVWKPSHESETGTFEGFWENLGCLSIRATSYEIFLE